MADRSLITRKVPNREALTEFCDQLKRSNIQFALGGSGLLSFFGCTTDIHDWDLTTDATMDQVEAALQGLSFERIGPSGIFATKYLFKVNLMDSSIDLMGGFAIKTGDGGIYEVPTIVTADWDGIPIGSPRAWIKVYELLGRQAKAEQLRNALDTSRRIV